MTFENEYEENTVEEMNHEYSKFVVTTKYTITRVHIMRNIISWNNWTLKQFFLNIQPAVIPLDIPHICTVKIETTDHNIYIFLIHHSLTTLHQ
jgi:hypothetical protein